MDPDSESSNPQARAPELRPIVTVSAVRLVAEELGELGVEAPVNAAYDLLERVLPLLKLHPTDRE